MDAVVDVEVARPECEQVLGVVRRGRAVLVQVVDHLRPFVAHHGRHGSRLGGLQGDVVAVDVGPGRVAPGVGGASVRVGRGQYEQGRTGEEGAGRPVLGEREVADRGQTRLAPGRLVPVLTADQQHGGGPGPLPSHPYEPQGAPLLGGAHAVDGDPVALPVHRGQELPFLRLAGPALALARLEPGAGRAVRGLGGGDGERDGERGERRRHGRPAHRAGAPGNGRVPRDRREPRVRAEHAECAGDAWGHRRLPPGACGGGHRDAPSVCRRCADVTPVNSCATGGDHCLSRVRAHRGA